MTAAERRAGYLDDLGRLLQPLTPLERIEVIDGVREHIDGAVADLGRDPEAADMDRILAELGDPQVVADEAIAGRQPTPAPAPAAPAVAPTPAPAPAPAPAIPEPAAPAQQQALPTRSHLADVPALDWPDEPAPRPGMTRRWLPLLVAALILLGSFFGLFLLPLLLVVVGAVLLWMSPLWTPTEKAVGTIVPPITIGAFLPVSVLVLQPDGTSPAPGIVLILATLAGVATLVWLAARGTRAARRHDQEAAAAART